MKQATISYTKNNLSRLLELVKRGETVTILDRKTPIAQITPLPPPGKDEMERRLDELERKGLIRRGSREPMPDWILKEPPPKAKGSFSISEYIREERDAGW